MFKFNEGQVVNYRKHNGDIKVATIIDREVEGRLKAYILDDGHWCYEHQIVGVV